MYRHAFKDGCKELFHPRFDQQAFERFLNSIIYLWYTGNDPDNCLSGIGWTGPRAKVENKERGAPAVPE